MNCLKSLSKLLSPGLLIMCCLNLLSGTAVAQVLNGYATVAGIAGTVFTVSNVDETGDSFEDGERIIIMQVQDDVIGTNTADDANFGLIDDIESAGLYEVATILSHTESVGVPATITISSATSNTYNVGANSTVQIISYPELGSPDYTIGNATAKAWDGNNGGVLAFSVDETLTINGDLNVDELGFRGASANGGGSTGCTGSSNYRLASTANFADKGEGIYKRTSADYAAGRARIATGGGGGNSHNAGGGGGSNYTAGGDGGAGWPNCSPSAGGIGGVDLSAEISSNRIFLGGGAGAGEANNGGSQKAGNGGGIILIQANTIETTGASGDKIISANGGAVLVGSGNDGNSGGGAGGSIIIQVNSWSIAAGTPMVISADGGKGGDVTHPVGHGAGGGGGQGTVQYSIAEPSANTTTTTAPGLGGANCTTCAVAAPGGGAEGDGVKEEIDSPLPVELIYFTVSTDDLNELVNISWGTASEINSEKFIVEKSINGGEWFAIDEKEGAGNSFSTILYESIDYDLDFTTAYYRLKQLDYDGNFEYSKTVQLSINEESSSADITVFPNPNNGNFIIESSISGYDQLLIFDVVGNAVYAKKLSEESTKVIPVTLGNEFMKGSYFIKLYGDHRVLTSRIIVR